MYVKLLSLIENKYMYRVSKNWIILNKKLAKFVEGKHL